MIRSAEPHEKSERPQFSLFELLLFVLITFLGMLLLVPTNRPEIELANCLIMVLSTVLGSLIGIFSSRTRTSRRIIFPASGAVFGWLLTFYLTSVLSPPRYPLVSDRGRHLADKFALQHSCFGKFRITAVNFISQQTDAGENLLIFNPDSSWVPTQ